MTSAPHRTTIDLLYLLPSSSTLKKTLNKIHMLNKSKILRTSKEYASKAGNILQEAWQNVKSSPKRNKRVFKISLSLTLAVGLTLPPIFANFHGTNPFLLGTVAIYLFPFRTIGGQIVATAIGLAGIISGIGYANLILFLARLVQSTNPEDPSLGRRVVLWGSFLALAVACGYIRSKFPRANLATIFCMIVNMFALIKGINQFEACFHNFFYVMIFGACVSLLVCFLVFPEDHSSILRDDMLNGVKEAQSLMEAVRHAMRYDSGHEADIAPLKAAHAKIHASLCEAGYEMSISRVSSCSFVPFDAALARLVSLGRVFNSSMRRRNRLYPSLRRRFEDAFPPMNHDSETSSMTMVEEDPIDSKQAIEQTFGSMMELFDGMSLRVQEIYRGQDITSIIDHGRFATKVDDIPQLMANEIAHRTVKSTRELEEAAFRDQINTVVLDMFDVVTDTASILAAIEKRRLTLWWPHKIYPDTRVEEEAAGRAAVEQDDHGLILLRDATTPLDRLGIFLAHHLLSFRSSRHIKYGIKLAVVMGLISLPAFIQNWYIWYENLRVQWALISAMIAMETTRGMTFRTAGMKLAGALMGGVAAWIVMEIGGGRYYVSIALTSVVGVIVGFLALNPKFAKAGTVLALAYNVILGVATVFPDHGTTSSAFARRILTLPVGVLVAMVVHITLFPFGSRTALAKALSHSLDWMHHLLFAIEASSQYPHLEDKFDDMAKKAGRKVDFAKLLLPATVYEVSLAGHWPYERFERILEKVMDVMILVVGENEGVPVMARSGTCETLRLKLLASLCNDLLVISHTLSARLFMPRNESLSTSVLSEYQTFLLAKISAERVQVVRNFSDLGRLADLVHEMNSLREEVDELITETQCPKRGLLPQLSFIVKKSRPPTPVPDEEAAFDLEDDDESPHTRAPSRADSFRSSIH